MQPHVISSTQPEVQQAMGDSHTAHLKDAVMAQPVRKAFSPEERAGFYMGEERLTLQNHNILRVRELQEMNDNLQREISRKEKLMLGAADPLAIAADVEHAKIMLARNTGEILKIYTEDEERRRRIAELEAQNIRLRADMSVTQSKFITDHDMQLRTRHAAEFFLSKSKLEKNIGEIIELCQL
ncbi:MAG: hypothetical protein ACHQT8_01670 [Chlamydiales bacterium]